METMNTINKIILILAALIFVGSVVGAFFFGRSTVSTNIVRTEIERDTIVVRDTIRESYPVEVVREVVRREVVKVPTIVRDTIFQRDSVWVELPTEEREYKGKDYRAVVGGFNPYLKTIEVYPETRYISTTETIKERKRWGFGVGVQGGYGYTPRGFQPYVGIGFSFGYNF